MHKEVRRYEWEEFLATLKSHYEGLGCDLEIKPRPGAEGFRTFLLTGRNDDSQRSLDDSSAYRELAALLYPGEAVSVLSVHKPKEAFLGSDYIYIAVETLTEGPQGDVRASSLKEEGKRPPS